MTNVYRDKYLKMIIKTLKENVKETSNLELDEMVMTHFGITIEEECYAKNPGLDAYSKAVTRARMSIEKSTTNKRLFPMIAATIQPKANETVQTIEKKRIENNNGKQTIFLRTSVDAHRRI